MAKTIEDVEKQLSEAMQMLDTALDLLSNAHQEDADGYNEIYEFVNGPCED